MKTSKISSKIMKVSNSFYRYACSCGSPECDMWLDFEADEYGIISLSFCKTLSTADYYGNRFWLTRMWKRIKLTIIMLFTGKLSIEGELVIQDEAHIQSLIDGLKEGINYIKESEKYDEN